MKEIKSLTGLRGLAALYVLLGHVGFLQNKNSLFYKILPIRNFIDHGYISVDLFFVLSGFVLMLMYNEKFKNGYTKWFKTFILKRFIRIFPLYIFCLLIYFLIYILFPSKNNVVFQNLKVYDILFNFLLVQTIIGQKVFISTSWSLSTEWIAYFIFPIICFFCTKFYNKKFSRISFFVVVICICLYFISSQHLHNLNNYLPYQRSVNEYTGLKALLRCVLEVMVGAFIFNCSLDFNIQKLQGHILLILLVLIALTYYDFLIVVMLALLVLSLVQDQGFLARILTNSVIYRLGLWSYSIYLLHPIFIGTIKDMLYGYLRKTTFSHIAFPISLIITFSFTIYFSFLSYKYIEVPAKKKLGNWLLKK